MNEQTPLQVKQSILEYWTLVEFFSPYLLENVLKPINSLPRVYADTTSDEQLPWSKAEVIDLDSPSTPFSQQYHLYLGIFNVEETADRARHFFQSLPSTWHSTNWKSCGKESSMTAFARLTVTTHGIPLLGTLSLSTLPWAHGSLLNEKRDDLTTEKYWKSVNRLLYKLRQDFSPDLPTKLMKKDKGVHPYLNLESLKKLVEILFDWASFRPKDYPIALIKKLEQEQVYPLKEPKIASERDVPILNSFYIQDLESAAELIPNLKGKPLDLYLTDKKKKRIALDSEEGKKTILKAIHLSNTPGGRWPDPLKHRQSLMQQFAINKAFELLKEGGVFSVNGPPGTGKTSLLREIIAGNIVNRALALSKLNKAKDAFTQKHAVSFENFDSISISELDPSLVGYEMLVVSSNNSAVQNLSTELPLRTVVDPIFSHISYMESVAPRVFNGEEGNVWGLISAPFGNRKNCRHFIENIFTSPSDSRGTKIWDWVEQYQGLSFAEAKGSFNTIKKKQERVYEEIATLIFLHEEIHGHTVESYCSDELNALTKIEETFQEINQAIALKRAEEAECNEMIVLIREKELILKEGRPSTLSRMINRESHRKWKKELESVREERLKKIEQLQACKLFLKTLAKDSELCSEEEDRASTLILEKALLYYSYLKAYESLKAIHPEAKLPLSQEELEETDVQIYSYYQTDEINRLRTELFIAALILHEAWLAETLSKKGGFRGNLMAISKILQGKTPTTADDTRRIWQSAFMLIPVISSTLASVGKLFGYLNESSIGWVFIDEAGQAAPQAAVGAIWRAQRVLAIGDPFQIEPINTIPGEVVDGMAKSKLKDHMLRWAPSQISVQTLMDQANSHGILRAQGEENYWIGSPLRVHRRCLEPMFSISNSIAYEDSMVLATKPTKSTSLPASCWWDVQGSTQGRQYVKEQGEALIHLLKEFCSLMEIDQEKIKSDPNGLTLEKKPLRLPPSFYVISPFKEVIHEIQRSLASEKELRDLFEKLFGRGSYVVWIQKGIGTVHSFQGKQADVVFFILGGDRTTQGTIEWVTKKPNLLNVAVTRAHSRFYIIADYELWKNQPYFDIAAEKLERRVLIKKRVC